MPYAIIIALVLLLGGVALVADHDDGSRAPVPPPRPAPLAQIERRVERLRGLEFRTPPKPLVVTPATAQRDALASLDTDYDYPPARRRADAEVLTLLRLVPAGTDLRDAVADTYGEAVAGYYDPRSGRLRVVRGAQTSNRVLYETTLAHELDHALEDQRLGFDLARAAAGDDTGLAYTALLEGSASVLMLRYAEDRFSTEEALGGVLASAFADTGDLPPFLAAQLVFPYVAGEAFVNRLLAAGGGRWDVVDAALRFRPPASTEQVMHPDKYLHAEQPRRVSLRGAVAGLRPGWEVVRRGRMGEWMTGRLVSNRAAAAGWGGDAYALLHRSGRRALVARWVWDTQRDAGEFAAALRGWARARGASAQVSAGGGAVTLVVTGS
jgi:hypothetical protein